MDDHELIEAIRRGDQSACTIFARRYGHRVFRYLVLMVSDYHHAEDLTSEVLLRAFQAIIRGNYNARCAGVYTWLRTIAEEVRFKDGIENLDHRALDNLVLQRRDAERALPPVRFRNVGT